MYNQANVEVVPAEKISICCVRDTGVLLCSTWLLLQLMLQDSAQQTSSHIDHNGQPAFTYDSSSLCSFFCLLITHSAMFRTHLIRH